MSQIKATDLMPGERNVLEVYNRLCTVSNNLPDYDEDKKGFDMCLMLLKREIVDCWYINQLQHIRVLECKNERLELKVDDLKEDNKVLKNKIHNYETNLSRDIIASYNEGYRKVTIEINEYTIELYMIIELEEFDALFEEASIAVTSKRIKKHPENTIRSRLFEFFRAKGFKCK